MIAGMSPLIIIITSALILILILGFWELVLCEGAHLGRRVVIFLYNLTAGRYDRIKQYDHEWERRLLGDPIINAAGSLQEARILDVGAGTGRAPGAVFPHESFKHRFYCLEPAHRMLETGRIKTQSWPVEWIRAFAVPLPFPANCFDFVICLEMLEFTPNPSQTVHELVRVLRPAGWLLITNRTSPDAALIAGKTMPREVFPGFLEKHGLQGIETYPWQHDYDLVWAQKPGVL